MTKELVPGSHKELARIGLVVLPVAIERSGPEGIRRFLEFFAVTIRNKNTRAAYVQATKQFFDWCELRGVKSLNRIEPVVVAAYIEQHKASAPTVKQHLAAMGSFDAKRSTKHENAQPVLGSICSPT